MNKSFAFTSTVFSLALVGNGLLMPNTGTAAWVSEAEVEFIATGDFDGDGRDDVALVEKSSGKCRIGYQLEPGIFGWAKWQPSGLKYVSGMSVGKLFAADHDGLAFASADSGLLTVLDAKSPSLPTPFVAVPFTALGPSLVVAADVGGEGNTPLMDLYVGSVYNNDPTPNRLALLRNAEGKFSQMADTPLTGTPARGNRVSLKSGAPAAVALTIAGEKGDTLRVEELGTGKPVLVASAADVTSGSDYVIGNFRGAALGEFILFKPGENALVFRPVEQAGAGGYAIGDAKSFTLDQPVKAAYAVPAGKASRLLLILGEGTQAGVYDFDGSKAPALSQSITNREGEAFYGAAVLQNGFVMISGPDKGKKMSTKWAAHQFDGTQFTPGKFGGLSTLDDTDDVIIPDVHKRIVESHKEKTFADMKPYTNVIPGTTVTYAMLPIPGGEFLMGSPEGEKGRKPDESPQHKVKLDPFWMAKVEITWNEYELFMYPDDEKRLREANPTEDYVNKLSDAVTRPSKPYVEMSFGMGKDGYPAIAMTHHAANKYCQWLSAKTGHFYRLPTEAEWEYACRAGTTTAYYFGEDASKLGEYAWSGKNSDFKYQKVGKKKPNAWGLQDMYGNVLEWCLDQYDPEYYRSAGDKAVEHPWNKATKPYPHCARGGCWDDEDVALFRSAARRGSDRLWKMTDPQLPKSVWYLSDAQWIGFRIVRPLAVPSAEEMTKYWISGTEKD